MEPPGISRESALSPTRARARAKDSTENVATAEKSDIQPATALRVMAMLQELGSKEDTQEPGAKEDSKEKARESGKYIEMKHERFLARVSRRSGSVVDQEGYQVAKSSCVLRTQLRAGDLRRG